MPFSLLLVTLHHLNFNFPVANHLTCFRPQLGATPPQGDPSRLEQSSLGIIGRSRTFLEYGSSLVQRDWRGIWATVDQY
ncbi:hypothetical protein WG66_003066 [Moniliophthora roreri]|nr:hypothetical protein WG66_003066 [Moniliophthora roreri]